MVDLNYTNPNAPATPYINPNIANVVPIANNVVSELVQPSVFASLNVGINTLTTITTDTTNPITAFTNDIFI